MKPSIQLKLLKVGEHFFTDKNISYYSATAKRYKIKLMSCSIGNGRYQIWRVK